MAAMPHQWCPLALQRCCIHWWCVYLIKNGQSSSGNRWWWWCRRSSYVSIDLVNQPGNKPPAAYAGASYSHTTFQGHATISDLHWVNFSVEFPLITFRECSGCSCAHFRNWEGSSRKPGSHKFRLEKYIMQGPRRKSFSSKSNDANQQDPNWHCVRQRFSKACW